MSHSPLVPFPSQACRGEHSSGGRPPTQQGAMPGRKQGGQLAGVRAAGRRAGMHACRPAGRRAGWLAGRCETRAEHSPRGASCSRGKETGQVGGVTNPQRRSQGGWRPAHGGAGSPSARHWCGVSEPWPLSADAAQHTCPSLRQGAWKGRQRDTANKEEEAGGQPGAALTLE